MVMPGHRQNPLISDDFWKLILVMSVSAWLRTSTIPKSEDLNQGSLRVTLLSVDGIDQPGAALGLSATLPRIGFHQLQS